MATDGNTQITPPSLCITKWATWQNALSLNLLGMCHDVRHHTRAVPTTTYDFCDFCHKNFLALGLNLFTLAHASHHTQNHVGLIQVVGPNSSLHSL